MTTYYVSAVTGDDGNNGTNPTTEAWGTIDHAVDNCAAGDTIYIAPGNYREVVTQGVSGTSGNVITIIGDVNCEKFVDIAGITPGLVRLTQAAAGTELPGGTESSTIYGWSFGGHTYLDIYNIIVDGIIGSSGNNTYGSTKYGWYNTNQYTDYITLYNCSATVSGYGFYKIYGLVNCAVYGAYYGYRYIWRPQKCLAVGCAGAGFRQCYNVEQCLVIGGVTAYSYCDYAYNCTSVGAYYGAYLANDSDVIKNHSVIGAYIGVRGTSQNGTVQNCFFQNCRYTFYYIDLTAPNYFAQNYELDQNMGGDTPVQAAGMSFSMKNYDHFVRAAEPWMFKGLEGKGANSLMPLTGSDILGRARRNTSTGSAPIIDIGAYEFSTFSGSIDSNSYYLNPPGINIQGKGEVPFQISVPSGSSMTASVYVKTTEADYPPSLVLRGISQFGSGVTTDTDAGSSWADNTFQQLVVKTPTVVKDEVVELVMSGAILTTSSFSDINVEVKTP